MTIIAPTYLGQTEQSSVKLTPAQEAERRLRQQRINRQSQPGAAAPDAVDIASATLHARLHKSTRSKPSDVLLDLAGMSTFVADEESEAVQRRQRRQVEARAEARDKEQSQMQRHALERAAHAREQIVQAGAAHASASAAASEHAQRLRIEGANRGAAAMFKGYFDQIYDAGRRLLPGGPAEGIEETLQLLQQMTDDAGGLPVSAYEQDNAATHAARLQVSFDFLQGFYTELPLSQGQQDAVQLAIANARKVAEAAMQQAAQQRGQGVESAHASLGGRESLPAESASMESARRSNTAQGNDVQPSVMALQRNQGGTVTGIAEEAEPAATNQRGVGASEGKHHEELERARKKLIDYRQGVDELTTMLTAAQHGVDPGAVMNGLAELRKTKPEISLLRLERSNASAARERQAMSTGLDALELACKALAENAAGKRELAKAIAFERQRLARLDDRQHQAGDLVAARNLRLRELHEARHKTDTLLKINTGSGGI